MGAFVLAGLSLVTGLVSAWYWYQSSVVKVEPRLDRGPGGRMPSVVRRAIGGLIASGETSAALNKKASLYSRDAGKLPQPDWIKLEQISGRD
jgi:hypothetical protein